MEPNELITKRWSPRAFFNKTVEEEKLQTLFEATRWTPSSMNEQPWRFVLVEKKNKEAFDNIIDTLMDGNKDWASTAPVLICVAAKCRFDYRDLENRHAIYDTGQAVATFTLQATDLGLYVRQMGGFTPEKAKKNLQIPDGFEPIVILALGYANQDSKPERTRNEKQTWVFENRFGQNKDFY